MEKDRTAQREHERAIELVRESAVVMDNRKARRRAAARERQIAKTVKRKMRLEGVAFIHDK